MGGVLRTALLNRGLVREQTIPLAELRSAVLSGRQLVAFNSVRGIYPIELLALAEETAAG